MKHTRLLLALFALTLPGCATHYFVKEWRQWTPPAEIQRFPRKSEPVPNATACLRLRTLPPDEERSAAENRRFLVYAIRRFQEDYTLTTMREMVETLRPDANLLLAG